MCGENQPQSMESTIKRGSPPHVRGKRIHSALNYKTPMDHPRMCGENVAGQTEGRDKSGSPPHVRGKLYRTSRNVKRPGITPACAGKTKKVSYFIYKAWDHPRMCGENMLVWGFDSAEKGSPPHVRGKPELLTVNSISPGITPACAGKTWS